MDINNIDELALKFKKWQQIESKQIVADLLVQAQKISKTETQTNINLLLEALTVFHKGINKSPSELIDEEWFQGVQKAKKNLRKILQDRKKQKNKPPELIRSSNSIEYPEELTQDKKQQEKTYARILYKNFLMNMPETIIDRKKEIIDFIERVINQIYELLEVPKEKNWMSEDKSKEFMKRVEKIGECLKKREATKAKEDMLDGIISHKGVSAGDPESFISQRTRIAEKKRLQEITRQNETGFYDQLKKNINKDAKQQCRFCHKDAAYCEGQKQIRAADQPMTRFMVCNACGKRWRQE